MEIEQKIQRLEIEKQALIHQAIMAENALNGLRQQASQVEGQLIELRLILPKKDAKSKETEKPKTG